MASKEEKRRRAAMVQAMVDEDTKKALAEMPLSLKDLGALFDYLDIQLGMHSCDHTPKLTSQFLTERNLSLETVMPWLEESGGHCDWKLSQM